MAFRINCPCIRQHEVSAAQAGCEFACPCGRRLVVPALGQLKAGVAEPTTVRGEPTAERVSGDAADDQIVSHKPVRKVSTLDVMSRDPSAMRLALMGVVLPLLAIPLSVLALSSYESRDKTMGTVVAGIAVLGLPAMAIVASMRRARMIRRTINDGPRVEGEITSVWHSPPLSRRPTSQFEYRFAYNSRTIECSVTVVKSPASTQFHEGDVVTIAVNHGRPHRSLLVDIYLR